MSNHAILSPSARHRWSKCPASVTHHAKYPQTSSPAAMDGTFTHYLLEQLMIGKTFNVGDIITTDEGDSFILDQDRLDRALVAVDYVKQHNVDDGYTEYRVHFGDYPELNGSCDIWFVSNNTLYVVDYKDGVNEVEVEENPQLEQYALGIIAGNEWSLKDIWNIKLVIIQPKLKDFGKEPIKEWSFHALETAERFKKLLEERDAALSPDAPTKFVAGEKQCQWCKHRPFCDEHVNKLLNDSGLTTIPIKSVEIMDAVAKIDINTIENERLVKLIEAAPFLESLLNAAKDEVKRRLDEGQTIEGLKLVAGRGSRKWAIDEEKVVDVLTKMGVPKSACYETSLITVPKVEKLTWTKKDNTTGKLSSKQIERLEEYVVHVQGKPTVALATDSRKEVKPLNVEHMFEPTLAWLK